MRARLSEGHAEAPLFLYVGRLSPEKGIETLRAVLESIPGSRLAIVGGGPGRSNLEVHFADTPTFFAGYLTGRELAEAMASVDALILPSKTETLGLVLMEGMAAGTIVIGADAGGISDVIKDDSNGFLFNPDLGGDLARVARRVLTEPRVCETVHAAARRHAEEWNWTRQLVSCWNFMNRLPGCRASRNRRGLTLCGCLQ
jgi:glycosyltransferase involved in cell wall biosynthesis